MRYSFYFYHLSNIALSSTNRTNKRIANHVRSENKMLAPSIAWTDSLLVLLRVYNYINMTQTPFSSSLVLLNLNSVLDNLFPIHITYIIKIWMFVNITSMIKIWMFVNWLKLNDEKQRWSIWPKSINVEINIKTKLYEWLLHCAEKKTYEKACLQYVAARLLLIGSFEITFCLKY